MIRFSLTHVIALSRRKPMISQRDLNRRVSYLQEVELAIRGVLEIKSREGDVEDLRWFRDQHPGAA